MQTIKNYLLHLETERKSKNTIDTYRYHLNRFRDWRDIKNLNLKDIRTKDFTNFKIELLQEGKSDRTVNAIISCVRGFFDYLILEEKVENNPVANALHIRVRYKAIPPLTNEQLHEFYQYNQKQKPNIRAAFHALMATGARVGEVAALKKGDFSIVDEKLFINIYDAKWNSDRKIPVMLAESARIIVDYVKSIDLYSEPAFRVSKRTLQTHANIFQKKTGIKFHCHIIRHTFATRLLEQNVDIEMIQFLLGHKSVNMTRHYTQQSNIDVRSIAPTIWQDAETGKGLILK